MPQAANSNLGVIEVYGGRIPRPTVAQCRVCSSPHRDAAEALLLEGRTYNSIVPDLPLGCDLTPRNIAEHFRRGHMALDEAIRAAVNKANGEVDWDRLDPVTIGKRMEPVAEAAAKKLVPALRLAELVVERAEERLREGDLEVSSLKDAAVFAALCLKYAPNPTRDSEALVEDLELVLKLVREVFSRTHPLEYQRFCFELGELPWSYQQY